MQREHLNTLIGVIGVLLALGFSPSIVLAATVAFIAGQCLR
jgi:hypothetical protein